MSNNAIRFLPASMGLFRKAQRIDCSNNLLSRYERGVGGRGGRVRGRNAELTTQPQHLVKSCTFLPPPYRVPPTMGHLKFIKELNLRYNSLDDRCGLGLGRD